MKRSLKRRDRYEKTITNNITGPFHTLLPQNKSQRYDYREQGNGSGMEVRQEGVEEMSRMNMLKCRCGAEPKLKKSGSGTYAKCDRCGAETFLYETKESAIWVWNYAYAEGNMIELRKAAREEKATIKIYQIHRFCTSGGTMDELIIATYQNERDALLVLHQLNRAETRAGRGQIRYELKTETVIK
jgi:hypothetical protein